MTFYPDDPSRCGSNAMNKEDVKQVLDILHRSAHFCYAFLVREPPRNFCILVDDDFSGLCERLSIEDFSASYPRYHARLAVCSIHYRVYSFRRDWDTQAPGWRNYLPTYDGVDVEACWERAECTKLHRNFEQILAHSLRGAMRSNRPFELTPETIEAYGFTPEDVAHLEPLVARCNAELCKELRADYERLAALDCIREEV